MVLYLVEPSLEFTQVCYYHEVQYDCGFGGLFIIYKSLSVLLYFPGAVCAESCQVFLFPLSLFDSLLHLWTLCLTFFTVFCHVQWKQLVFRLFHENMLCHWKLQSVVTILVGMQMIIKIMSNLTVTATMSKGTNHHPRFCLFCPLFGFPISVSKMIKWWYNNAPC